MEIEFESFFYKERPNDPLAVKWNYGWDFANPIKPRQSQKEYRILDQSTQLIFSISSTLKRALEICKEHNFTYFLIKKISYTDERGQSLVFQGVPETEGGVLVSETIVKEFDPPVGKLQSEFEIFFFKDGPRDPLAVVVGKVFGFLH